jgi:uncharacterized SAM-binding protein YcdF (DUF218 family)
VTCDIDRAAKTLWRFHCVYDDLQAADVVVGLGSYDLRVAERCVALYHAGLSPLIVLTGASGNWTRGLYPTSEAEAFAAHAMAGGVPADAILVETDATNIGENVTFTARMLPHARTAIFVTKPQTQRRCQATVSKQWPAVQAMITAPLTRYDDRTLICEMVGDLERLRQYPVLGFQSDVEIPESVLRAYRLLTAAGYTDHLPRGSSF